MQINKYDRQIRLWGANGQKLLSEASICLVGCSGAGIQAVKNLILPGVGQVDIWDDRKIQPVDLSTSFFYEQCQVGLYRAEVASRNLLEMNPDVGGQFHNEGPQKLLADPTALKKYTLIICSDLTNELNARLSQICWSMDIPVVFILTLGFSFYIRNQKKRHFVETEKSTGTKEYMRLSEPFQRLTAYSAQWNISNLVHQVHTSNEDYKKELVKEISHIPFPVLLMQARESQPQNARKKANILSVLKAWQDKMGVWPENFQEAETRVLMATQTSDDYLDNLNIISPETLKDVTKQSAPMLVFLKGCAVFYEKQKRWPQSTNLPDIHTTTKEYLTFKQVYKDQHKDNVESIFNILGECFEGSTLSREKISTYIENLTALHIMSLAPYYEQIQGIIHSYIEYSDKGMLNLMLSLQAYKTFISRHNRAPKPADFSEMKSIADTLNTNLKIEAIDTRYIAEACRAEGQTTISICSMAGAVGGQEGVKLITGCYQPVNNGFLYNGMTNEGFSTQF